VDFFTNVSNFSLNFAMSEESDEIATLKTLNQTQKCWGKIKKIL
jgi:hypothetical protein